MAARPDQYSLDLSAGMLDESAAALLASDASRFMQFTPLSLDGNVISPAIAERLRAALRGIVHVGVQRDPDVEPTAQVEDSVEDDTDAPDATGAR